MNTFPAISSIVAPELLGEYIESQYGLSNLSCEVFRTGINHTYRIQCDEARYMFRLYCHNWRSEKEIEEELRFIGTLKANNISISYPIADASGRYIQQVIAPEGLRYGVLFSFAEGEKIRQLTEQDCYQMGVTLAQIHKASLNLKLERVDYNIDTLVKQPYHYALKYFSADLPDMQFIVKAQSYLQDTFAQVGDIRHGAVHLDYWYDNMSIADGSNITLFDFDFCGNGWQVLDVAYCSMQLFNIEVDKNSYEQKLASLYKGYESITPISKEERELIPAAALAIWIFYLGVQSQRFNDWSNIFLTKNYLKHYIGLVKSWCSYHNITL